VELIVEEKEWRPGESQWGDERLVAVQIAAAEVELRGRIKQAGGRWDGQRRVWELPHTQVVALGLAKRVVVSGREQSL
jgi:hypothetical protein